MRKKITMSELLFYIAYIIWIVPNILAQTYYVDILNIEMLIKIARITCFIILIGKIIFDNSYLIKTIFSFGVIFVVFIIVYFNSSESDILMLLLFIYSARNLSIRDIIKVTLLIQISMMIFTISSNYLGIIKDDLWYRENGKIRCNLGYTYCTFAANYYFNIVLMYLYLKDGKKFKLIEAGAILLINYIIYAFTDTKAVFYLVCLLVILAYMIRFFNKPLKSGIINKLAFKYCFPIDAIVSIVGSINYDSSNVIYAILNKMFSGRLELGRVAYEQFGIDLFGQKIKWITGRGGIERGFNELYNYVDCSYLNIAISYGLVILVILCVGFVLIGKFAINNNKKYVCLVLMFLAIHSMSDPQLIELTYNPFLLALGVFFNSDLKKNSLFGKYDKRVEGNNSA